MYDHLVGEVCEAQGARAVLRAGGVGYELKVPVRVATELREGESARLFTVLHVVDGMPTLLGFAHRDERELARRMLAVSGVGPSIALAILSTYGPEEVAAHLTGGDVKALQRVKGVGAKTAERLCLELRDRIAQLGLGGAATATSGPEPGAAGPADPVVADAVAALVTLGYAESDARKRVQQARDAGAADTETLIRGVLRG